MKTVLVIEDNVLHMKLFCDSLKMNGYMPIRAFNGRAGIATARQQRLDLIVLDINLPDRTGVAVMTELKADEVLRRIPVIAVTAADEAGKEDRYLNQGFDGFVGKPITLDAFLDTIGELTGGAEESVPGAA